MNDEKTTMTKNNPTEAIVFADVIKCQQLNLRAEPDFKSKVLCVLDKGTTVMLCDLQANLTDWVKVCTGFGIEGYVIREFIKEQ